MIYSRNSEDMTAKYPEVLSRISTIEMGEKGAKSSYILDCEMVAFNKIENKILPFQVLSTRKRKDVTEESVEVHVCVFAFDLLYLNGEPLVEQSFRSRRTLLTEHFMSVPGEFQFAQHADPSSTEEIQSLLDEAIASSCEGLMVKTLDQESSYEPSKRSRKWLKVKKDYLEGCGDSLDLVVIGGYIGRGKRTGVYGGFLLACFDPDCDEYQAICKIGTGFSETDLESHAESLKLHQISTPKTYYRFTEGIKPDVWFAPVQVWEVKAADFSISPVYTAGWGLVDEGKGISLRFPRFLRVREDKTPEMASNSQMIADLYNAQSLSKPSLIEEEDY